MNKCLSAFLIFVAWGFFSFASGTIIHVPGQVGTIQGGIDLALDGDTVLVDTGVYHERIDFLGKEILVGSYFIFDGDTNTVYTTVIDGDSSGTVVTFSSGEGEAAQLIGFTVTDGFAWSGGGIKCTNRASPLIAHNVICYNNIDWYGLGGGIYCEDASPVITHNLIRRNNGAYYGGGIYLKNSSGTVVEHNRIVGQMTMSGYGVAYGAGIHCEDSEVLIRYNLIRADTVDFGHGGGISCQGGTPHIVNNTIVDNVTGFGEVGGIYCMWSGSPVIVNNIIAGNGDYGIGVEGNASPDIDYNDLWQNGYYNCNPGPNDLSCDPQFCDPQNLDFTLYASSCCVGAGQNGEDIGAYGVGCGVLQLEVILDTDTTYRGAEFGYTVSCTNYTGQFVRFRFQTYAVRHTWMYPLIGPVTLRIPPYGFLSGYITHIVPGGAPYDDYSLCAEARDLQGHVYDQNCEPFVIVPRPLGVAFSDKGVEDWRTESAVIGGVDLLNLGSRGAEKPVEFRLSRSCPNPFNATTKISYDLVEAGDVTLKIYDISGRLVQTLVEGFQQAGEYDVLWDASEQASGIYLYRLSTGDFTETKRMTLLR